MVYQILPVNPLDSRQALIGQSTTTTHVLYGIVTGAIILVIGLLPLLRISISLPGRGVIRPLSEKTEIKTATSESVTAVFVHEGQYVSQGDTLLLLRPDVMEVRFLFIQGELEKLRRSIHDLESLKDFRQTQLLSEIYTGQYQLFKTKLAELDNRISKAHKEMERNRSLFENELISSREFDDLQYKLDLVVREKQILESDQKSQWNTAWMNAIREQEGLRKQLNELERQKQLYTITAPVSGTIEEFSGIHVGTALQAGQTVAVISPQSEKIAEVYVSAKDIGYLREGQEAKIQVDAFNYNQWGILQAEIMSISDDFLLVDNTPVFKVKCRLSKDYLELRNGVRGNIKKGMTVNARFMMAKRSLFQLLYQKSDDWLNPARSLVSD